VGRRAFPPGTRRTTCRICLLVRPGQSESSAEHPHKQHGLAAAGRGAHPGAAGVCRCRRATQIGKALVPRGRNRERRPSPIRCPRYPFLAQMGHRGSLVQHRPTAGPSGVGLAETGDWVLGARVRDPKTRLVRRLRIDLAHLRLARSFAGLASDGAGRSLALNPLEGWTSETHDTHPWGAPCWSRGGDGRGD